MCQSISQKYLYTHGLGGLFAPPDPPQKSGIRNQYPETSIQEGEKDVETHTRNPLRLTRLRGLNQLRPAQRSTRVASPSNASRPSISSYFL